MVGPLARVAEEAHLAASEIRNDVDGVRIPESGLRKPSARRLPSIASSRLADCPGTGKSVVLRSLVEEALANGPVLFLKGRSAYRSKLASVCHLERFGAVPARRTAGQKLSTAGASPYILLTA